MPAWSVSPTLSAVTVSSPPDVSALQQRVEQLERELDSQRKRLKGIQQIGRALGSTLNLDRLLLLIMDKITELMGAERSTLFLIDESTNELWSKIAQGARAGEIRIPIGEGIAGWVASTGQSLNIKDAYKDSRFNQDVDRETGFKTSSMLCVPIRNHRRRIVGVVQVLNSSAGYFTVEDEALLGALGSQAAVSLENSKLYLSVVDKNIELLHTQEQLRARAEEIDLLFRLEQQMNQQFGLDAFLATVLEETRRAIPSQIGAMILRSGDGSWQLFVQQQGNTIANTLRIPAGQGGIPEAVADSGKEQIDNEIEDGCAWLPEGVCTPDTQLRNALCVPLVIDDERFGSIALLNQAPGAGLGYTEADAKMMTLVAGRAEAAVVVERRRSQELDANRLAAIGQALSGVLHDLKTPMTIIGGYAQLMVDIEDPKERAGFAESIMRQLVALKRMTGEILGFARGDSNLLIRKVYLHTFMPRIEEALKQEMAGREIELKIDLQYRDGIRMDIGKLERVIFNLARNARQAMPDGGTFSITTILEELEDQPANVIFEFADSGPGVPETIRHTLFESFVTSGKKGGTGLGLAIVKKVVDLHGGSVEFDSVTGVGTTFRIRMPRNMES
ncbi:MAG: signal transduction histidine kinase [Myxococcota bacterium]